MCSMCNSDEKVLNKMEGVSNATVNLATNSAVVEYNEGLISTENILEKIKKTGYKGQIRSEDVDRSERKEEVIKAKTSTYHFNYFILALTLYNDWTYAI